MFEKIEWIFFDVGSTLIDESIVYHHRFEEIARLANISYQEVYQEAISYYQHNQKGDHKVAERFGVKMPKWRNEEEVLYERTPEVLKVLSTKYKIGIIANQSLGTKNRLESFGILKYIDLVIASAEEGVLKPDPRIFELALTRSGCPPENAVMVGDRIDNDIAPAKRIGMHAIWVRQGFSKYISVSEKELSADCVIDHIEEICDYL